MRSINHRIVHLAYKQLSLLIFYCCGNTPWLKLIIQSAQWSQGIAEGSHLDPQPPRGRERNGEAFSNLKAHHPRTHLLLEVTTWVFWEFFFCISLLPQCLTSVNLLVVILHLKRSQEMDSGPFSLTWLRRQSLVSSWVHLNEISNLLKFG